MAQFAIAFTATQSSDGKTITLTDTSNWPGDENYNKANFVRTFTLRDAYGATLDTIVLDPTEDVATYTLNTNKWIAITFTIDGSVDFSKLQEYPFGRLFELAYIDAVKLGCGCSHGNTDLCDVDAFYSVAQMAVPVGDGQAYQENIDAAYSLLLP